MTGGQEEKCIENEKTNRESLVRPKTRLVRPTPNIKHPVITSADWKNKNSATGAPEKGPGANNTQSKSVTANDSTDNNKSEDQVRSTGAKKCNVKGASDGGKDAPVKGTSSTLSSSIGTSTTSSTSTCTSSCSSHSQSHGKEDGRREKRQRESQRNASKRQEPQQVCCIYCPRGLSLTYSQSLISFFPSSFLLTLALALLQSQLPVTSKSREGEKSTSTSATCTRKVTSKSKRHSGTAYTLTHSHIHTLALINSHDKCNCIRNVISFPCVSRWAQVVPVKGRE